MLDENLRKKMCESYDKGDYEEALRLSQILDEQILTKVKEIYLQKIA